MIKTFALFISFLYFTNIFSQEYQKDTRSQYIKEDVLGTYKAELIDNIDILNALKLLGVNVYKFNIGEFDKKYNITITMDEYSDGVKLNSLKIAQEDNTYFYSTDSVYTENSKVLYDYIDQLSFYTKENDSIVYVEVSNYSHSSRVNFHKKNERDSQFYSWRYYRNTKWKLNIDIPLLIYASSWFDSNNKIERFCGIAVLSEGDEATEDLLISSPHYYRFNLKVTEKE